MYVLRIILRKITSPSKSSGLLPIWKAKEEPKQSPMSLPLVLRDAVIYLLPLSNKTIRNPIKKNKALHKALPQHLASTILS
jgi:hypothetical protein